MKRNKTAFTMVELVFVIVVLGILAGVAIPRLTATRDDAVIAKGRSDVAAIRSSIKTTRARRVLEGNVSYSPSLTSKTATSANLSSKTSGALFAGVLDYAVHAKHEPGHWQKRNSNGTTEVYRYRITSTRQADFTYDSTDGSFDCDHSGRDCRMLTE